MMGKGRSKEGDKQEQWNIYDIKAGEGERK